MGPGCNATCHNGACGVLWRGTCVLFAARRHIGILRSEATSDTGAAVALGGLASRAEGRCAASHATVWASATGNDVARATALAAAHVDANGSNDAFSRSTAELWAGAAGSGGANGSSLAIVSAHARAINHASTAKARSVIFATRRSSDVQDNASAQSLIFSTFSAPLTKTQRGR